MRPEVALSDSKNTKSLADELLFGRLKGGGKVRVEIVDGKIALGYPK